MESQPKISEDNKESSSKDTESSSKVIESDSSEVTNEEQEENTKHANMVLKEKLYNEQKSHNRIGLIKNAELLSNNSLFSSSITVTKPKQKAVHFKASWSGELESTKRLSKNYFNSSSISKGNLILKLNRMDIKSTCPVFFSGNLETDSIYLMYCDFKCDDEIYYTTKQYPIYSNNPTISMNEDINIPLDSDQNTLEINIMMIKKTPLLMPSQPTSKSYKNSNNNSGMSTLTHTMTHPKKTIQQLMFWKKNKHSDGFSSVNTATMNYGGYYDNGNFSQKNDLQFRSLSSNSSISKMFASDGNGANNQLNNYHARNYHPSIKTIFNTNNNTSNSAIPYSSNGLSPESTADGISGSNCSLNSTYSSKSTASSMTTTSSSSPGNIFVAGKIVIDLKNIREQHMGELIDENKWEIIPPKPLKNNPSSSGKYN